MKLRKMFFLILMVTFTTVLVSCGGKISITLPSEVIAVKVDEVFEIKYETSDKKGLDFESENPEIATVDDDGVVRGITEGTTNIILRSKSKTKIFVSLKVNVTNQDGEVIKFDDITLAMGMQYDLGVKESEGYSFELSNPYVASITSDGILNAELQGDVIITVSKDGAKLGEFDLLVMNKARSITLTGSETIYTNDLITFEVSYLPRSAYPYYEYIVEDESILTIDDNGVITPKAPGTTMLRVKSLQDDETFDEMEVTIKSVIVVKGVLGSADTLTLGNWEYKKGVDLFMTITDAIAAANDNDKVLVLDGTYDEEIIVDKSIVLEGKNAIIEGEVSIEANNVIVTNLTFNNDALVNVIDESINSFEFVNNKVLNINTDKFVTIEDVYQVVIANNEFDNLKTAVTFANLGTDIDILIEKNTFTNLEVPLEINANNKLVNEALLRIYRNTIETVNTGFVINLAEENNTSNATLYTRFNEVTDYQNAITHTGPNNFEHTFNYWGEFDLGKFDNVDEAMLLGHYSDPNDFIRETAYNPNVPLIVTWDNVIDEIWLGENHEIEITAIPYSTNQESIQLQVINMELAELISNSVLTPKQSGEFHFRVGSYANPTAATDYLVKVTTDPGIHLDIDNPTQDLTIGNRFSIKGEPYPYDLAEEPVSYISSNPSIATITVGGLVEIVGEGEFEITVSMVNQPTVIQKIGFKTYEALDDNNILDFYTSRQLAYSQVHHIELHGADSFLRIHNESVTRVLADTIESVEKIIPVASGFRPGTLMRSNIPDKFKLNDDNVVWVVVHDTGNSNAGAGAMMHGTYLFNAATSGGRQASWHYTIDSHLRFQSVPENEIAYHAGDGSGTGAVPKEDGESPALGGGNTNGIGIEMSVQRDGDVWKTWQNTAQFSAGLLHKYNLPLSHITYHNDFSGKNCPQTLRRAGLLWLFEEFIQNEYDLIEIFGDSIDSVGFKSHNPEILDNTGVVVNTPNTSTNVSYTLEVVINGETHTRTFTTLVEGLWR